jgi:thiol-disulfide isomerase/thioredoxin
MARLRLTATMRASVAVAACAAVVLAGCAGEKPATDPTPTRQSTSAPAASAPDASATSGSATPAVPEELRFTAKTVDGADFDGASLAGKPAVVWFWASWCPKCQAEASGVRAAADATAGSVTFLGVAAMSDVPAMRGFVDRYEVGGFTHLADEDAAIWQRFGVVAQPAYAFVAADGTVEVVTDRVDADELLDRARALAG